MEDKDGARDYVGIRRSLDGQSLGELEAQILDIIWTLDPPVSTTQVFKIMYPRRELSYSTIMLTMAKLARKGILEQKRVGDKKTDPFIYTANMSREQICLALLNEIAKQIFRKPLHEVIPDLCGTGDCDISKADLAKLGKMIGKLAMPSKPT